LHSGVTLAALHATRIARDGFWRVFGRTSLRVSAAGGLMFKRLHDIDEPTVTITVEGRQIEVPESDSVAAAILTAGIEYFRTTPISGIRRAPYCMMGTCFECLVEIDGVPNQQACQTQVRDGMSVKLQKGASHENPI